MSEPVTLIVGRGLIGSAVADRLRGAGHPVRTVAHGGGVGPVHRDGDLSTAQGLRAYLGRVRADRVVLTHGPSDAGWVEANEAAARTVHVSMAEVVAAAGIPAVLISTEDVFRGDAGGRRPQNAVDPGTAYGRVMAAAERTVLATGRCLALRVSLVYGWTRSRHPRTFGQQCVESALRARPLRAPTDQAFTPVHVADVARVVAALCRDPRPPVGIAHLSGDRELSRFEFATAAYRAAGADERLVQPCLRADTEWASRPRYSSLRCDSFPHVPGLDRWRPLSPEQGLRLMLGTRPGRALAA